MKTLWKIANSAKTQRIRKYLLPKKSYFHPAFLFLFFSPPLPIPLVIHKLFLSYFFALPHILNILLNIIFIAFFFPTDVVCKILKRINFDKSRKPIKRILLKIIQNFQRPAHLIRILFDNSKIVFDSLHLL